MSKEARTALILLSGGMDSATLLYYVPYKLGYTNIQAISFNYHQRHVRELEAAKSLVKTISDSLQYEVKHKIIEIDLSQIGGSPLTDLNINVPTAEEDKQGSTVVPARNSIFLSLATAYAETQNIDDIFFAPNKEDFRNYPDCRLSFVNALSTALVLGNNIRGIYAPLIEMSKREIIDLGYSLCVPWEKTWSCYVGGEEHCWECDACSERKLAFKLACLTDPLYKGKIEDDSMGFGLPILT